MNALRFAECAYGIFGDLLMGDSPMRFVFIDEAGTAATEPVTVVIGLIVNADKQLMRAEGLIREILGAVPPKFGKDFVFHAKDIWGHEKYRDDWGMSDRLGMLRRMMELPRKIGIPVTMSMVRRSSAVPEEVLKSGITAFQFHHFLAFAQCVARADKFIRDHANPEEVGTVVAEDVPGMRKFLKKAVKAFRENRHVLAPGKIVRTRKEVAQGYITQETEMRVTRIRQNIHFVDKEDDLLTQVADACAFGFRRFFAEQSLGEDFARSIVGGDIVREDYSDVNSTTTFFWPSSLVRPD